MPTTSYNTGTASVDANATAVTGQGTQWIAAGLREGDLFWARGLSCRIASVNSATSLTLAYPWPGSSQGAEAYEIQLINDGVRALAAASQIVSLLDNGNLLALSGLASSAAKLPFFIGAGTASLTDITTFSRQILALTGQPGRIPVATGTDSVALRPIVGPVSQASGVPTGAIVERGATAAGQYVRYADGTQICWVTGFLLAKSGSAEMRGTWTFPAAFSAAPAVTHTPNFVVSSDNVPRRNWGPCSINASAVAAIMDLYLSVGAPGIIPDGTTMQTSAIATGRWF